MAKKGVSEKEEVEEKPAAKPVSRAGGPSWLVTAGAGVLGGILLSLTFVVLQIAGTLFPLLGCLTGMVSCCVLIWLLPLVAGGVVSFIVKSIGGGITEVHGLVAGVCAGLVGGIITTASAFILPMISNTLGGVMSKNVAAGVAGGFAGGAVLGIISLLVYPVVFTIFAAIGGALAAMFLKK